MDSSSPTYPEVKEGFLAKSIMFSRRLPAYEIIHHMVMKSTLVINRRGYISPGTLSTQFIYYTAQLNVLYNFKCSENFNFF